MPDPRDVLPVLGWCVAVLVAAAFGVGALRAAMDWRAERRRDQAHADALTCDAIHEAGRVAGHRAGYDVGHRRAWDECYPHAWQLGCTAGEARMRRANARAQLGLPDSPAPRVCQLCCVRCVEPESHHALCGECQRREMFGDVPEVPEAPADWRDKDWMLVLGPNGPAWVPVEKPKPTRLPARPWTFDPRTRIGRQLNGEK